MKRRLDLSINKVFSDELYLLYGDGSHVEFTLISESKKKNSITIHYTLYFTDFDLFDGVNEAGIIYMVEKCWQLLDFPKTKLIFVSSFKHI